MVNHCRGVRPLPIVAPPTEQLATSLLDTNTAGETKLAKTSVVRSTGRSKFAAPYSAERLQMSTVTMGNIDHALYHKDFGDDDVVIDDKIDGQSRVEITAHTVTIRDKIDGQSNVDLKLTGGSAVVQHRVDGQSVLRVTGAGDINIGEKVDGQSVCYLHSKSVIRIGDRVDGSSHVFYWAPDLVVQNGVKGNATATKTNWGNFPDL